MPSRSSFLQVNRGLSGTKLNQVLEAKWQEFQDKNPYNQTKEVVEEIMDSSEEDAEVNVSKAASSEESAEDPPQRRRPRSSARKIVELSDGDESGPSRLLFGRIQASCVLR